MPVQISVTVKPSFAEVSQAFNDLQIDSWLRDEIHKIAFRVERFSKQIVPVRTGRLRSSIATSWMIGSIGARVMPNTDYAYFVHEGTKYMRGRPFMEKGAEYAQQFVEGDIKARLDDEVVRAFKRL